jgi:predicted Zn-dependent peptidase
MILVTGIEAVKSGIAMYATTPVIVPTRDELFPFGYPQIHRLSSGALVIAENTKAANVRFTAYVRGGSRNDGSLPGLAHYTEHMISAGAKGITKEEAVSACKSLGANRNAKTSRDTSEFYIETTREAFNPALSLQLHLLYERDVRVEAMELERSVIENEHDKHYDSLEPADIAFWELLNGIWKDHPYSKYGIGNKDSIRQIAITDVEDFHSLYFPPNNTIFTLSGNFTDLGTNIHQIEEFSSLFQTRNLNPHPVPELSFTPTIGCLEQRTDLVHFTMGFKSVPLALNNDCYKIHFLCSYLSRELEKRIRHQNGLVYGIGSYNYDLWGGGATIISSSLSNDKLNRALELMSEIIHEMKKNGIPEKDLKEVQRIYKKSHLARSEDLNTINWYNSRTHILDPNFSGDMTERYIRSYSITSEDLKRLANEIFTKENFAVFIVGTDSSKSLHKLEEFRDSL